MRLRPAIRTLCLMLIVAVSLTGCGSDSGFTSLDVSVQTEATRNASAVGEASDVTSVTVDVLDGHTTIISGQALTAIGNNVWSGTLLDIPVGSTLTIIAHAYNISNDELFSGSLSQLMQSTGNSVSISMSPSNDGQTLSFPQILQITRPAEIINASSASVSVIVNGTAGETLSYEFVASQGIFTPALGNITLGSSGTGTIVTTFYAPLDSGSYIHEITVTNNQGNSVTTTFDTTVVSVDPALTTSEVKVTFNPVILALNGQRSGTSAYWTASVDYAGPVEYTWTFDGGLPFANATANPATMLYYNTTTAGTIALTVNDAGDEAISTTVYYTLLPGQFPDNLIVNSTSLALVANGVMPMELGGQTSSVVNGMIYLIGGYDQVSIDFRNTVTMYDPVTDTWTPRAPLQTARADHKSSVANGKIYVFGGGGSDGFLNTVEEYDPVANTWTTVGTTDPDSMISVSETVNDKIYVLDNSLTGSSTTKEFDPLTYTWSVMANTPTMRDARSSSSVINGKIYVEGGINYFGEPLAVLEAFDPAANTWTTLSSMPMDSSDSGACALNGKLYVSGGYYSYTGINTIFEYDPATDIWLRDTDMLYSRYGHSCSVVDGAMYIFGSHITDGASTFEVYQ